MVISKASVTKQTIALNVLRRNLFFSTVCVSYLNGLKG